MFPFQRSCELSFQQRQPPPQNYRNNSTGTDRRDNQYHESTHEVVVGADLIKDSVDNNYMVTSTTTTTDRHRRKLQGGRLTTMVSSSSSGPCLSKNDMNGEKKKSIHREIERQRRQDMAKLFSSLRSLLPTNSVKGKRSSISDHITEAAEYIKTKETNIKELKQTRDGLLHNWTTQPSDIEEDKINNNNNNNRHNTVVIQPWSHGRLLEIELSMNLRNYDGVTGAGVEPQQPTYPSLSRLLNLLVRQGLNIVTYSSAKLHNRRFLHIIHAQVDHISCFDPSSLQRILQDELCSSSSI